MKKIFIITIIIFISICSFYLGGKIKENKMNKKISFLNSEIEVKKNDIINLGKQNSELQKQIEDLKTQKQNDKKEEYKHPIDKELERCINSTHPYLYSNCAEQNQNSWDKEIQQQLKRINKLMSSNDIKYVTDSQADWNKSFKSDEIMINKFISNRQGTVNETLGLSYISNIKKQRALLLEKIYDNYKEEIEIKKY